MWHDRVSVVTGATSGIGRAMALELARRGCTVVGVGRNAERLAQLRADLNTDAGQSHQALSLNVADEADMDSLRRTLETLGRVDLLVASAVLGRDGSTALPPRTKDLTLADWQAAVDVNLHGIFLANKAVLDLMIAAEDGDIVNIASSTTPHGLRGTPLAPAYCATKFAIAALGREIDQELGPQGIRVRTVFPGSVDTPLIADTMLDGPFGGRMRPESFATALVGLIELGGEMVVPDPHLLPVPGQDLRFKQDQEE
ncbi:MAG: SDR family oxidoreductase [Rhodobacteraceae bacterium]|nr:SDR family oxidoreductase [Paracoccaceae bacterium]